MSVNRCRLLERVVVAGSGLIGHLAALALRRALPSTSITLVSAPADRADLTERLPALFPAARAAMERLGLNSDRLVAAGLANHRLADEFADWGARTSWLHAFGAPSGNIGPGAFHQLWLNAKRHGAVEPFHHYLPAAVLAEAGRFTIDTLLGESPFAHADFALRLDSGKVSALLARQFAASRIEAPAAPLARITRTDDDTLAALRLADGRQIEADLYLDCTGSQALLIGAPGNDWQSWVDVVGIDRLLIGPGSVNSAPLLDRYRATEIGWQATLPLPGGPVTYGAWRTCDAAEGRARRIFGTGVAGEVVGIAPGCRTRPFRGNVVALGDASAQPGPLFAAGLSLAVLQLDLLIELLPCLPLADVERDEFNRRAALLADRAHDLAALPVLAARRATGPFWVRAGKTTPPTSLSAAMVQFRRRGLLPRPEADLIEPDSWRTIMLGLGIVPDLADPIAAGNDPAALDKALQRLARNLTAFASRVPPYVVKGSA